MASPGKGREPVGLSFLGPAPGVLGSGDPLPVTAVELCEVLGDLEGRVRGSSDRLAEEARSLEWGGSDAADGERRERARHGFRLAQTLLGERDVCVSVCDVGGGHSPVPDEPDEGPGSQ